MTARPSESQTIRIEPLQGWEPLKLDDRMHKLDIRVSRHGLTVRARKEYLAAKPPSTP